MVQWVCALTLDVGMFTHWCAAVLNPWKQRWIYTQFSCFFTKRGIQSFLGLSLQITGHFVNLQCSVAQMMFTPIWQLYKLCRSINLCWAASYNELHFVDLLGFYKSYIYRKLLAQIRLALIIGLSHVLTSTNYKQECEGHVMCLADTEDWAV